MSLKRKQRSIADILAVLIVIGITIVAGVALYSLVMGKVSVLGNSAGVTVENSEITNNMLIITVKNTGTYTLTTVTYDVYNDGTSVLSGNFAIPTGGLAPGETTSPSTPPTFSTSTPEVVGASYTIVITGTYSSGQTYSTSVNVIGS